MGQISVPVNGRPFTVTCDDGQEARLRRLAQYVDAKVAAFVAAVGQVGDAKLLLLTALAIADELADANEALQQEHGRASSPEPGELANGVHGMSKPVEPIAARLRTP
jgi:cell division protein ZapA